MKWNERLRSIGIYPVLLIGLVIVVQLLNPNFATPQNLINVLRQISILAVLAFGMTFVIIGGGVDLSVGSIIGLVSVISSMIVVRTDSVLLSLVAAALLGAGVGSLNGLITAKSGMHAFIVTLGTMTVLRGIAFMITDGMQINGLPSNFLSLASGRIGPIPVLAYFAVGAFILSLITLRETSFGRAVYAVGGRPDAANVAGIKVGAVQIGTFAVSGFFAAIAGVLMTSRVIAGAPSLGAGYDLQAIAAVILGGTPMGGGRGGVGSTALGVLIIGVLANGLNLLKVSSFWQEVAVGAAIVIAIAAESLRGGRRVRAARM